MEERPGEEIRPKRSEASWTGRLGDLSFDEPQREAHVAAPDRKVDLCESRKPAPPLIITLAKHCPAAPFIAAGVRVHPAKAKEPVVERCKCNGVDRKFSARGGNERG